MFWVGSRGERKSKVQHAVSADLGNQMVCLVRDFVSAELVVWWFVALLTNSCFPAREGGQTDSSKVLASPRSVTKLPLHAAFVSVHAQVVPACSSEQILWFWLFCCVSGQ